MESQKKQNDETGHNTEKESVLHKRWIGHGIYGSKDVPIKILDGLFIGVIALILMMVAFFTIHGGYSVRFDSDGGNEVAEQSVKYGKLVTEPAVPVKPGFDFAGWTLLKEDGEVVFWNFAEDKAEGDMTLFAVWKPAEITVKFDLTEGIFSKKGDGNGTYSDESFSHGEENVTMSVIFGESYGKLPVPEREGYVFEGWQYSGMMIQEDTIVTTSGEHVLTAVWK